ncbi:MAG: Rod binding protein [Verrucomicrobiota bacterium]|jgi:Rod binding domain-containing protein
MQLSPLNSALKTSDVSAEDLVKNKNLSEKEKVHELCRQFEAILLRQILNDAQKTVIQSGLTPKSSSHDVYQDMAVNQLADSISKSGSFGLGQSLETQLSRQVLHPHSIPKEPGEN